MIVPAWIASYSHRLLAKWMRADSTYGLGRTIYWNAVNGKIQRLKQTPGVVFLVALVDGLFAGWACEDLEKRVLHYVYVRDTFRRQGIATDLVGWINSADDGLVILAGAPPVWFTNRGVDPLRDPWKQHQIIDTMTVY